jgi:hypothetical protein
VTLKLPRHVIYKKLASGHDAYYYNVPSRYRTMNCPVSNEALGTDYAVASTRAATLNGLFDEWEGSRKGLPVASVSVQVIGTVDWLFREYKQTKAFTEKVAVRSRKNYEWTMREICDTLTKKGDRVGSRPIKSISPRGADKLYDKFASGEKGNGCARQKK